MPSFCASSLSCWFAVGTDKARVPIYIRKSSLRLPMRSVVPVIMVGPGTGLAPFRAFVEERHLMKQEGELAVSAAPRFGLTFAQCLIALEFSCFEGLCDPSHL